MHTCCGFLYYKVFPFFRGISVRNYTDEGLNEINGNSTALNGQGIAVDTSKNRTVLRPQLILLLSFKI